MRAEARCARVMPRASALACLADLTHVMSPPARAVVLVEEIGPVGRHHPAREQIVAARLAVRIEERDEEVADRVRRLDVRRAQHADADVVRVLLG